MTWSVSWFAIARSASLSSSRSPIATTSPPHPPPFPTPRDDAPPFPPLEVRFLVNQLLPAEHHDPVLWCRIVLDPAVESLREVLFLVLGVPRHRGREVARVDEAGVVVRFIRPIPPGGLELVADDVNRPLVGAEELLAQPVAVLIGHQVADSERPSVGGVIAGSPGTGTSTSTMLAGGASPQAARAIASATVSRGVDRLMGEPVYRKPDFKRRRIGGM